MKVILKETMENLGTLGDIVNVTPGYARNFLIPRNKAILASSKQIRRVEHEQRLLAKKLDQIKAGKAELKSKLEDLTLTIRRKAGENDKLFGSVTNQDIEEALKEKGYEIDRRQIKLDNPIKKLGAHKVPCQLMDEIVAELNVAVVTEV